MGDSFKETYACQHSSGFTFRVGDVTHRFDKHQLVIEDEEVAKELDEFLAKYPTIGNKVKKVDLSVAEALVAEHKATHGGAHSGPFSSQAMAQMETDKLEGRDAQFAKMSPEAKANVTDAMAKESDLILTEKVASATQAEAPTLVDNTKPNKIGSLINKG